MKWIPFVERFEDMSPDGKLRIQRQEGRRCGSHRVERRTRCGLWLWNRFDSNSVLR